MRQSAIPALRDRYDGYSLLESTGELDAYVDPIPDSRHRRLRRILLRCGLFLGCPLLTVFIIFLGMTLPYRWHEAGDTAFMRANPTQPVIYQWVNLDHISRYPMTAAIVLEDSQLGKRRLAFDVTDFSDTVNAYLHGENPPGGSTIPQQLVKNLYLSADRAAWRKAIEAPLSVIFNAVVSDRRILELYMNYAQFGDHLYGICAASWYYFVTPPWSLSLYEGSQLAAILRLPDQARRAGDGGVYVLGSESSKDFHDDVYTVVPQAMAYLGGYESIMKSVGITDTASDHADERGSSSCSTMPGSVADLLHEEGYR